jgi:hypothetical protein
MNQFLEGHINKLFMRESSSEEVGAGPSLFEKYKKGIPLLFSAFKLYSTDVSENGSFEESPSRDHQGRGPYRKYTLQ